MAAGLVMVAHRSGGPLMDIVIHNGENDPTTRIGFLATDEEDYSNTLAHIIRMDPNERESIREAAR